MNKPRILVVDDDEMVLNATVRSLKLHGFECVEANHPEIALKLLQEQDFAAVVSDMMMPGMNGLEFYDAALKKMPALKEKFVFVTGGGYDEEMEGRIKTFPHLHKPYRPAHLVELLQSKL